MHQKKNNILITGGNGMVGSLVNFGIKLSHQELDICNTNSVKKAFGTYKPSSVLHLAALDINACQKDPVKAYEVNVMGTFNIAKACKEKGIKMIYMSSCIIYNGKRETPYDESDYPSPIHIYGRTKAIGEQITSDLVPNSLIIRPGWLFGNYKINKGFVNICLNKLKNNEDIIVNTLDRLGSPTYIPDMLFEVKKLIDQNAHGIYHIVNAGTATYFEIGLQIRRLGRFKDQVKQTKEKDSKIEEPKRGKMEALTSTKIKLRPWRDALAEFLQTI